MCFEYFLFSLDLFQKVCCAMIQNLRASTIIYPCDKHQKPIKFICIAPQCSNYRELCQQCIKHDSHHAKMHFKRNEAFEKIQIEIDNLFKGLKALRKKIVVTMETKINSHHGLSEIEEKLEQIKRTLNNKIDQFHSQLKRIYEKNIKEKLNQLFYLVQKSYEFLEEEKIKLVKTEKLRRFFVNDLTHDLKYYQSYFEEILQKNVRKFKTGFEHDKVLKLMISFEQNLSQIFKFQSTQADQQQANHILYANNYGHFIYQMKGNQFKQEKLGFLSRNDAWIGIMPSVYYPSKDCYYLIGQGKRQSNKIRRMDIDNQLIKELEVKMDTKRMNFSASMLNNEIYIIGGQNSKQGCLYKCQKFVPSEGKIYIINSLNQRSAQHSTCTYKNKYILKFGGTDLMGSILEAYNEKQRYPLPEIYSIDSEEWRVINFHGFYKSSSLTNKIKFGLWPGIYNIISQKTIVVFSGVVFGKKGNKMRYDIKIDQQFEQINEMKIEVSETQIPSEDVLLSDCYYVDESGLTHSIIIDQTRNKGVAYYSSFAKNKESREIRKESQNIISTIL